MLILQNIDANVKWYPEGNLFPRLCLYVSVFVLVGKFNLGKLYEKIGFNKEIISRGRFAELTAAEQRPFR